MTQMIGLILMRITQFLLWSFWKNSYLAKVLKLCILIPKSPPITKKTIQLPSKEEQLKVQRSNRHHQREVDPQSSELTSTRSKRQMRILNHLSDGSNKLCRSSTSEKWVPMRPRHQENKQISRSCNRVLRLSSSNWSTDKSNLRLWKACPWGR